MANINTAVAPATEQLYVVPSNDLTATPTAIAGKDNLGFYTPLSVPTQNDGAGNISGNIPSGLWYATSGDKVNGDHLYYLNLAAGATPSPVQVSNLTLDGSAATTQCPSNLAQLANLTDANSGFAILRLAGADGLCFTSDDQYLLVEAGTSASASPTTLPVGGNFAYLGDFYSSPSGQLAGIVGADGNGNLAFYTDQTLAHATTLLAGAAGTQYYVLADSSACAFIVSTTGTVPNSVSKLYRVDRSGAISGVLYTSQTGGVPGYAVSDQNNLYFADVNSNAGLTNIVQLPLSGATSGVVLYADQTSEFGLTLIGSTGTQLVLETWNYPTSSNAGFSNGLIQTLAVSTANGSPTTVASVPAGYFLPYGTWLQSGALYTTQETFGSSGTTASYSAEVLQLNGTVTSTIANAAWTGVARASASYNIASGATTSTLGTLLLAQGITATDGSYGGGAMYSSTLSGTATALQGANGQAVTVAAGDTITLNGINATVGVGTMEPSGQASAGNPLVEDVFDLSKNLLVQLNLN